jgi:hypothetical protein
LNKPNFFKKEEEEEEERYKIIYTTTCGSRQRGQNFHAANRTFLCHYLEFKKCNISGWKMNQLVAPLQV